MKKFKYTNLTVDKILSEIRDKLNDDDRFTNFRESAIAQMLLEIFAGSTDITNYYLQRRAEECFLDTAQLKSSVISKSRELGYDISRKIPAKAKIKLVIEGDIAKKIGAYSPGLKIQVPYYTKFSADSNDFVLINTLTVKISEELFNRMTTKGDDFSEEFITDSFGNSIDITQGEIKEKIISGKTNTQVNAPFQMYKIEDEDFSNLYGDKDYFFNKVTKVYVGNIKNKETEYTIDRKSLINWEVMTGAGQEQQKRCFIRTAIDETVELMFGDGKDVSKGPTSTEDNIYIQYLSTNGSEANKVGVINNDVDISGNVFTNTGIDISEFVSFKLNSNILGGGDFETIESIKNNAPKIFYSLDRLVSKQDFLSYLKSLTAPINVKNAIAWGEQEEAERFGQFSMKKMFNVVLFCIIGSLYKKENDLWNPIMAEDFSEIFLDDNYDLHGFNTQGYVNIFLSEEPVRQLRRYVIQDKFKNIEGGDAVEDSSEIINIFDIDEDNRIITFKYGTDIKDNASNIEDDGEITVSGTGGTLESFATQINTQLKDFKDFRANNTDNENHGEDAFIGRFFDEDNFSNIPDIVRVVDNKLRFSFNEKENHGHQKTPAYIKEIYLNDLTQRLGIAGKKESPMVKNDYGFISGRITDLVKDLDTRSQVSVKSVYVSPILHRFNLVGDIYIKSLFDRDQTINEIKNSLYEWFDLNSDFNTPIFISNIINLIEDHPAVLNANVKLTPTDITSGIIKDINDARSNPNEWFENRVRFLGSAPRSIPIDKDRIPNIKILNILSKNLNEYLNKSSFNQEELYRIFHYTRVNSNNNVSVLEKNIYDINNYINERTFYLELTKNIYNDLISNAELSNSDDPIVKFLGLTADNKAKQLNTYNIESPLVNSDFVGVMNEIHKDLSYIIMANMLDSYGNINAEYNDSGVYIRGGYSLESEIVQINIQDSLNINYR